jgi:UDP-N-acetylenolpyruvoylglucosamine reductase
MVKTRVKAQSGIDLRWEIRRIGVPTNHSDKGGQHD